MANVKDIKLTATASGVDELFIDPITGDILAADSDTQHVKDLVFSFAGWYKENPTLGVGAQKYVSSSGNLQRLKSRIQIALKADGYKAQKIAVQNKQVYVTGERVIK